MSQILKILLPFLCSSFLFSASMQEMKWKKGESFLGFLDRKSIPSVIYYDMDSEDRELATEIQAGATYHELVDDSGEILQVLIPVGEELQLHIYKNANNEYKIKIDPVIYEEEKASLAIQIERSPYQDIVEKTNSVALANEFLNAYKKSVDFTSLKKGNKLVLFYSWRLRLGKIYGQPSLQAAMIEEGKKNNYVFLYNERYYNEKGKELEGYFLAMPLSHYKRISSPFTRKRWHPVLKRYRAHLGIDYAAPKGTRVKSAGDGKIAFIGRKGGYGKVIEISHAGGYKTLYAHLNGFRGGLKKNSKVKKGQLIGFVGTTGVSTGPHLHFGLYKNNRAINPNSVVKVAKNIVSSKERKKFDSMVDELKNKIDHAYEDTNKIRRIENFNPICLLENNSTK